MVPQTGADVRPSVVEKVHKKVEREEKAKLVPIQILNMIFFLKSIASLNLISLLILIIEIVRDVEQNWYRNRFQV